MDSNRRYLASLAGAAAVILVVGALLRPHNSGRVAPPPSPGQTAQLQALAVRGDLRDMAGYFGDRVDAVSGSLTYLAERRCDRHRVAAGHRSDRPVGL